MRVVVSPHAWDDYTHWQTTDRSILKRIDLVDGDDLVILHARFHYE